MPFWQPLKTVVLVFVIEMSNNALEISSTPTFLKVPQFIVMGAIGNRLVCKIDPTAALRTKTTLGGSQGLSIKCL